MADTPAVRVERDGPVTTVVLHRPHARNAVDGPTAVALHDAFVAFDADDDAAVAVLWGDGGTFCAGADLKALGTPAENKVRSIRPGTPAPMGPTRLRLSKPVIAAVSGHAVAGGLELACWADLRVVEESATLGVFCRRWGVPLVDGGTIRLPQLVGTGRALDLILTGRPVGAAEALAIGLANYVVADGAARAEAEALAQRLAGLPQACMRNDRLSALACEGLPLDAALEVELGRGRASLASPELAAGVGRFAGGAGRHGVSA
ncbi:MAG TPA: crotonase/enoyl-CoA hydratase family protein [Acidimicrobiales bacterium]|nr:crotonase/enoyl-CoA hydratase family protein [Acidimicrobiales bacterium]